MHHGNVFVALINKLIVCYLLSQLNFVCNWVMKRDKCSFVTEINGLIIIHPLMNENENVV